MQFGDNKFISISKVSLKKTVLNLTALIALLFFINPVEFSFAKDEADWISGAKKRADDDLTQIEMQARLYREQGLKSQNAGDLDSAVKMYQKAIELDPAYAVPYNDLGIIFETAGLTDIAIMNYLKCIKVAPDYLSAYSNLALLHENQRDLKNAVFYWGKRARLGSFDDPWTQKAKQRIKDIEIALGKNPLQESREQEVISLLKDVEAQNPAFKRSNKEQSEISFEKAKICQKKGDDVTALKLAIDASCSDPSNVEIREFIDKTQTRLLLK